MPRALSSDMALISRGFAAGALSVMREGRGMKRAWGAFLSLPLCACVAAGGAPVQPQPLASVGAVLSPAGTGVRVTRSEGPAYGRSEGLAARRDADALCGGRVRSSIYDHFEAGSWVFTEGCA